MLNSKRIAYFEDAYLRLRKDLLEDAPPSVTLTIGFPVSKRSGKNSTIGECHFDCFTSKSQFGDENIIVLHPITLEDPINALATLVHEMCHAALDPDAKHKKPFQQLASRCGLVKPWTSTTPDDTLRKYLLKIYNELGDLPGGHYVPPLPKEKKPTAIKKFQCTCDKPRILSLSPKKLEEGAIICGSCKTSFRLPELEELRQSPTIDEHGREN